MGVFWWHAENISAPGEDRTHDLQMARVVIMRLTRYLLRYRGRWPGTLGGEIVERGQIGEYFRFCAALERPKRVDWFCGVMVSTLDSESSDPSSNLGRTWKSFVKVPASQRLSQLPAQRGRSGPHCCACLCVLRADLHHFSAERKNCAPVDGRADWIAAGKFEPRVSCPGRHGSMV